MPEYWLALGSNLGNREIHLKQALDYLKKLGTVLIQSSVYETRPEGTAAGYDFLNMVCGFRTALQPFRLLRKLKQIETDLGRVRNERWGNRNIDLDIIDWNGMELNTDILTIPHPLMEYRAFVLIPMAECCPAFTGRRGKSVRQLIDQLSDTSGVRLY